MKDEARNLLTQTVDKAAEIHAAMLEGYAKLYLQLTGVGVEEICLVETFRDEKYVFYFAKKSEVGV